MRSGIFKPRYKLTQLNRCLNLIIIFYQVQIVDRITNNIVNNFMPQTTDNLAQADMQPVQQTHTAKRILTGSYFLNPSSLSQKFEFIWRGFFVIVMIAASLLLHKVFIFQTHEYFENIRAGNVTQLLAYGLPFALAYTLFDLLIHYLLDDICSDHYITDERYNTPQAKKKRCYTLVKWGYSSFYYLGSTLWAFLILKQTLFMPTWLGGKGSPYTMTNTLPKIDVTLEMKIFYIIQFGKHFSRFFSHVFIKAQGAFFQYCLHHGLSTFLIVFSYLTNQWHIGIFVLLIHDYSDFGLTIGRAYKDYKNCSKKVLDCLYVHGFIAWFGCRIFLFLVVCIIPATCGYFKLQASLTQFQFQVIGFPYIFMVFMMASLQVMHFFWTYFIIESFISVKVSSKVAKHSYD